MGFQEGSLGNRLARLLSGRRRGPGLTELHVADPRFDEWEPVRGFESLESARAWHQHLDEAGFSCALTSDWPLDRFRRGDISLCVPPEQWSEAVAFLDNLEAGEPDFEEEDEDVDEDL